MKRTLSQLLAVFLLSLSFILSAQAAETYTLDPSHSYVMWHINHFGFSNPSGKWHANGTLLLDETHPQNSKVNITIDIADMDTGDPELDKHLKGEMFFNVLKFPTATFISNKIKVTGKDTAQVDGTLTLLGVSKPVVLNVTLNKIGVNPINDKKTAGFRANTEIKRSDFGMTELLPGLSDEVKIHIEIEASKAN